jgi:hypothetical protein
MTMVVCQQMKLVLDLLASKDRTTALLTIAKVLGTNREILVAERTVHGTGGFPHELATIMCVGIQFHSLPLLAVDGNNRVGHFMAAAGAMAASLMLGLCVDVTEHGWDGKNSAK